MILGDYPDASKIRLVCDNRNVHSLGALYETFDELRAAVESWSAACNANQKGVDWQFTIEKARIKLKSLYPKIKMQQDTRKNGILKNLQPD